MQRLRRPKRYRGSGWGMAPGLLLLDVPLRSRPGNRVIWRTIERLRDNQSRE
jgi:hypothetical protein